MTAKAIDPPTLQLDVGQLTDWLELCALFGEFGVARIDALLSSLKQLAEAQEEDIGEADKTVERFLEAIENEIELREKHLGQTYPFKLGDGAEELQLVDDWVEEKYSFYLVCLITSHVTGSPILRVPPTGALLTQLRTRIFQILSTLAMAGLSNGPALSVGWPRIRGESIQQLMQRAADNGSGFRVRNPIGVYTPHAEKDGGIDVMAWTPDVTPPPAILFFGQAASGNNWEWKPVSEHARVFTNNYLQDVQTGNYAYATIIPFRVVDESFWNAQNLAHRSLIDRLRLPPHAYSGLQSARNGTMVDEADQIGNVLTWLQEYRAAALT